MDVRFILDTGASHTTFLPYHVLTLLIDWKKLPKAAMPCTVATGEKVYPRVLENVKITLNAEGEPNNETSFEIRYVHLMPPFKNAEYESETYSLLGMDVLNNFPIWRWAIEKRILSLIQPG